MFVKKKKLIVNAPPSNTSDRLKKRKYTNTTIAAATALLPHINKDMTTAQLQVEYKARDPSIKGLSGKNKQWFQDALGVGSVWISEKDGAGAPLSKIGLADEKSKEKDTDVSVKANINSPKKSTVKMNKSMPAQKRKRKEAHKEKTLISMIEPARKKKGVIQSNKSQSPPSSKYMTKNSFQGSPRC